MKNPIAPRAICTVVIVLLSACTSNPSEPTSTNGKQHATDADSTDTLLSYFLTRTEDLTKQIGEQKNVTLRHDNECLDDQIAILKGRPRRPQTSDPLAAPKSTHDALELLIRTQLEFEAVVQDHNHRHPSWAWADHPELAASFCGDCRAERAAFAKALAAAVPAKAEPR